MSEWMSVPVAKTRAAESARVRLIDAKDDAAALERGCAHRRATAPCPPPVAVTVTFHARRSQVRAVCVDHLAAFLLRTAGVDVPSGRAEISGVAEARVLEAHRDEVESERMQLEIEARDRGLALLPSSVKTALLGTVAS